MSACRLLTADWSDRTVIHVELNLSDSGMRFAAGDAVGVLPSNDPALVAGLLARLGVDGDDVFEVESASGEPLVGAVGSGCWLTAAQLPARRGLVEQRWRACYGTWAVLRGSGAHGLLLIWVRPEHWAARNILLHLCVCRRDHWAGAAGAHRLAVHLQARIHPRHRCALMGTDHLAASKLCKLSKEQDSYLAW